MTKVPTLSLAKGISIPVIGMGTWQVTSTLCIDAVKHALSIGYTHIDTAWIYGNEAQVGHAIKSFPRKDLFLTSKVWRDHLSYDDVLEACNQSLTSLKTNYLDLYLIHWPNREQGLEQTIKAMAHLHKEKKIRAAGVSNFTINHIKDVLPLFKKAGIPLTNNQVEFHPGLYQKALLEFCKKNNITLTAYSPLGKGKLTSNKVLESIGSKHKKTASQVSLRWLIQHGIIVIPRSTSYDHLKENFEVFDFTLSNEEMKMIDSLGDTERIINPGFAEFDY